MVSNSLLLQNHLPGYSLLVRYLNAQKLWLTLPLAQFEKYRQQHGSVRTQLQTLAVRRPHTWLY